jgi:hypothetical protein
MMKESKSNLRKSFGMAIWTVLKNIRNKVEGHYGQCSAGYSFILDFQQAYIEEGIDLYFDFLNELPSAS